MSEIVRALHAVLADVVGESGDAPASLHDIGRTHVPIYIFDAENHAILAANAAALQLYGYSLEEFLRLTLFDIRTPEEAERTKRFLSSGLPQGLWHSGVWRHRTKEGRVFTVNALGLSIVREGRSAVLAIVTDMTQTMRSPDAPEPPGSPIFPFAEQMDQVCWIRCLDEARFVYLNPAFEHVYGLPREVAYGNPDAALPLILEEDLGAALRYRQEQASGPARVEFRIRRPDGELRWLASHSFRLEDAAGVRMAAGFTEDITERKQAEQRRLEAIEAQRDAVVREVHHRIKNSLQGATGLIHQFANAHPELAPLAAELSVKLQSMATIHGLQGRFSPARLELCHLLNSIVADFVAWQGTGIATNIPPHCKPCLSIAEKETVPVALSLNEIVMNALKHGKPGGQVRLEAVIDTAAGTAEIRVSNPGRLRRGRASAPAPGSGLQLIRMLLPTQGARFDLREQDGEVLAVLHLQAPVIMPCQ